jgi:predicted alpha/beta-hydrolase family hydrolase
MMNQVTFPSADNQAELEGVWYLPTRRATNGAVIMSHGGMNNKDVPPLPALCEGAAQLGLTAVRFDFRYVHGFARSEEGSQDVDDLLGAYNFLQSFGKEIKPKRYYLIGKSLGGYRSPLATCSDGPLAGAINGVAVLGMALHDETYTEFRDTSFFEKLTCPALFVVGERDPLGSPEELRPLLERAPVPTRLEVIAQAGHSYQYIGVEGEAALSPEEAASRHAAHLQRVVDITLEWLEEQDKIREDLRK